MVSYRQPSTPPKEPETSRNWLFCGWSQQGLREGDGDWSLLAAKPGGREARRTADPCVPDLALFSTYLKHYKRQKGEQVQKEALPESRIKTGAQPSKTSLLPTGAILQPPTWIEKGGPQQGPKVVNPKTLHTQRPQPLCEAQRPSLSRGKRTPHHVWGFLPPSTATTPHSSVTMGPRGISNRAPLGLPRPSGLNRLPHRSGPTAPHTLPFPSLPSAETAWTLQTQPLRLQWNSLNHSSTLREPAPAASTSPAPRVVRAARSPPGGGWYCPPPLSSVGTRSHPAAPMESSGAASPPIHTHTHTHIPPTPWERKGPGGHPAARLGRSPTPGGAAQ